MVLNFATCRLCQEEYCLLSNFCSDCQKVKRIINIYGKSDVLDILNMVCLRQKDKRENKANLIKANIDSKKEINNSKMTKSVSFSIPPK